MHGVGSSGEAASEPEPSFGAEQWTSTAPLIRAVPTHALASPQQRPSSQPLALPALELARLGFRVFPCNGKRPYITDNLKRATSEPRQICEWWQQRPSANIGIAAHGLIVLDLDGPEAEEHLAELALDLPPTATVETVRGRHLYFRGNVAGGCTNTLGRGLDVRGNRDGFATAYALGPGSHRDGFTYEWAEGFHPAETPIAPAPPALIEAVQRRAGRLRAVEGSGDGSRPIPKGRRNVTLTSIAGDLWRQGLTSASMLRPALEAVNAERCRPPLPEAEVGRIAESAERNFSAPAPWQGTPREVAEWVAQTELSPAARAVLRCICDHANEAGKAWPSYALMQRLTGLGRNRVIAAVSELEEAGRIAVSRKRGGSHGYTLQAHLARPVLTGVHEVPPSQREGSLIATPPPGGLGGARMRRSGEKSLHRVDFARFGAISSPPSPDSAA